MSILANNKKVKEKTFIDLNREEKTKTIWKQTVVNLIIQIYIYIYINNDMYCIAFDRPIGKTRAQMQYKCNSSENTVRT